MLTYILALPLFSLKLLLWILSFYMSSTLSNMLKILTSTQMKFVIIRYIRRFLEWVKNHFFKILLLLVLALSFLSLRSFLTDNIVVVHMQSENDVLVIGNVKQLKIK